MKPLYGLRQHKKDLPGLEKTAIMTASAAWLIASAILAAAADSSSDGGCFIAPSYGDLELEGDLVLIYMGPDGTDYAHMWGTLGATNQHGKEVGDTLCRQLGYEKGTMYFKEVKDSKK